MWTPCVFRRVSRVAVIVALSLSSGCSEDPNTRGADAEVGDGGHDPDDAASADAATDGGGKRDSGVRDAATRDDGGGSGGDAGAEAGMAPECDDTLLLTLRDFKPDHVDFESFFNVPQKGIVAEDLGADNKPVHASAGATSATSGPDNFDQWYRDVDDVNSRHEVSITFDETSPGVFVYDNGEFFPLDGMGFGNGPDASHNFLFTTEAHTLFTYSGGEEFTFEGDDDLWIFINGKLAVDLGGVHAKETQTIRLDDLADSLGIEAGETYPMDIFHAERHTTESNFRIETTIDLSCIPNVMII